MKKADQLRKIVDYIKLDNKNIFEEFYSALLQAIHKNQQPNHTPKAEKIKKSNQFKKELSAKQEFDLSLDKINEEEKIKEEEKKYQEIYIMFKEKLLDPIFLKQLTTNFNRISISEQWYLYAVMIKGLIADYSKSDTIKDIDKEQLNRLILLALQITYENSFKATSEVDSKQSKENKALPSHNLSQNAILELTLTTEDSDSLLELIIIGSCISEFLKNLTDKEQIRYKDFIDDLFDIESPIQFYQKIIRLMQEIFFDRPNFLNKFDHLVLKHFYQPLKYVFNLTEDQYQELCKIDSNNDTCPKHSEIKVKIITLQLLRDLYPHRNTYRKVIIKALKQCKNVEDYLNFTNHQINYIIQKKYKSYSKEDKIVLHYCYQILSTINVENKATLDKARSNEALLGESQENDNFKSSPQVNNDSHNVLNIINSLKINYNKKLINLLRTRVEKDINKTKKQILRSPKSKAIILEELNTKKRELLTILANAENSQDLTSLDWCQKYVDKLEEILNFIESKNKHNKSTLDTTIITLLSSGQPIYHYKNRFLNQIMLINDFYNGKNANKLNPYRLVYNQSSIQDEIEANPNQYKFLNYLRLAEIRQMAVFRLNKYMYDRARSSKYLTFDLQNDNPSDQVSKQARFATAITSINLLLNDYDYKKQTIDTFLFKLSEQINNIPNNHSSLKRELRTIVYKIGKDLNHANNKSITIVNSKKIINQFVFNPSLIENLTSAKNLKSYHSERFSFSWKNDIFSPSLSLFRKGLNYFKDYFQTESYMKETKEQYQIICLLKSFLENDYSFYHDRDEDGEFYTIYVELCSVALSQISDPELKKKINKNIEMIFEHFVKQKNNGILFSPDQQYRINIAILRNDHPEILNKITNAQFIKTGQDYRFQIHKDKIETSQREYDTRSATQIFEDFLVTLLVEHFDAEKVLNSGKIARTLNTTNMVNLGLKSVSSIANNQLPGSGALLNTIAAASDMNELVKAKEVSQNISSLAATNLEVDELCKQIAKELTFMYEDQIKKLDSREIIPFARCAADRVMEEAAKIKREPNEKPDHNSLINAVRNSSKRHRWMGLKKAELLSSSKVSDYVTAEDLFSKPAVMVLDELGMPRFFIHYDAEKSDIQRYGIIVMETKPINMREITQEELENYGAKKEQYDEFIKNVQKRVLPHKTKIEESKAELEEREVSELNDDLEKLTEQCQQLDNNNKQLKTKIAETEAEREKLALILAEFNNTYKQTKQENKLEEENTKLKADLLSRDTEIADLKGTLHGLINILTRKNLINADDFESLLSPQNDPDEAEVTAKENLSPVLVNA